MKRLLIAASAAAIVAIPAIAQTNASDPAEAHAGHGKRGGWDKDQTRADVEKMIAERFAAADANKDGAVTRAEFDAHVASRVAEAQAKMAQMHGRMFERLDTDKNGQISRAEWDAQHAARLERSSSAENAGGERKARRMMGHRPYMAHAMRNADSWGGKWFEKADANNDGRVTLQEAKADPLAKFDEADTNRDGILTRDERRASHEKRRAEWKAKREG